MASSLLNVIKGTGKVKHAVGNLSNWSYTTINQGAMVEVADVDNFTFVELSGFNAKGDRLCKQLSDKTKPAYLIASVERLVEFGALTETMSDFYNAIGEKARIIVPERGKHFDSSAYTLNAGVTLAQGCVAHFDVATKKFIISASATPHADYATSSQKLLVVEVANAPMIDGQQTVRFEFL